MENRLDIVVFGATGFTGKYTLPHIHKFTQTEDRKLTWGIAGRSEKKLKEILEETSTRIGENVNNIRIIIADLNDENSIKQMTASARVVVNCCGPYVLYGEVVVKSCIETRTHHVDVSGEPLFLEGMELKYKKAAEEKGVYIVGACGFDSIPSDLGVVFLENNFHGTLNSVEVCIDAKEERDLPRGPRVHYGTWASVVDGMGTLWESFQLKKKLYDKPLPKFFPKLPLRFPVRRGESGKWIVPFLGSDRDIIQRSQRYFYEQEKKRPIQAECYIALNSFWSLILILIFSFIAVILAQFKFGRNLLLKYPELFSGGFFSHEDPSEEVLNNQLVTFTFEGQGWSERLAGPDDQYATLPNKTITGRIVLRNPGYGFTCVALALSAILILTEQSKLPVRGGVYTTAAAFSKTSIIEQLQKNNVVFEITSKKDL